MLQSRYVTGAADERPHPDALRSWGHQHTQTLRVAQIILKTLLQLLEALVYLVPLAPFLVVLKSSSDGETGALCASEVPYARKSLLQSHHTPSSDQLLALADLELQVTKLFDVIFRDAAGNGFIEQVEETDDYPREDTRKAIDGGFEYISACLNGKRCLE